jgi:hypothetical protein
MLSIEIDSSPDCVEKQRTTSGKVPNFVFSIEQAGLPNGRWASVGVLELVVGRGVILACGLGVAFLAHRAMTVMLPFFWSAADQVALARHIPAAHEAVALTIRRVRGGRALE